MLRAEIRAELKVVQATRLTDKELAEHRIQHTSLSETLPRLQTSYRKQLTELEVSVTEQYQLASSTRTELVLKSEESIKAATAAWHQAITALQENRNLMEGAKSKAEVAQLEFSKAKACLKDAENAEQRAKVQRMEAYTDLSRAKSDLQEAKRSLANQMTVQLSVAAKVQAVARFSQVTAITLLASTITTSLSLFAKLSTGWLKGLTVALLFVACIVSVLSFRRMREVRLL